MFKHATFYPSYEPFFPLLSWPYCSSEGNTVPEQLPTFMHHPHTIVVLENTAQNERYMSGIFAL